MTSLVLGVGSLIGCKASDIPIPSRIAGYNLDQGAKDVFAIHLAHNSRKFRDIAGGLFGRVSLDKDITYEEAQKVIRLILVEEDEFYARLAKRYWSNVKKEELVAVGGSE